MPQMAPYNWLYLNIMFSIFMIFYISYIYFTPLNFFKENMNKNLKKKMNSLKW